MKLLKQKKALEMYNLLIMIPRFIFTIVVAIAVVVLINSYLQHSVNSFDTEADTFAFQLLYSPTGISYFDPLSNRLHPGTIDLNKFNSQNIGQILNQSFNYGKHRVLIAEITLKDLTTEKTNTVIFGDKKRLEIWKVLAKAKTDTPQGEQILQTPAFGLGVFFVRFRSAGYLISGKTHIFGVLIKDEQENLQLGQLKTTIFIAD